MSQFSDPLWVVTSYYNPAGYKRRLQNFKAFRRNLKAPLMVVELAKAGCHQLSKDDGDIVLSLTGEDRIWQKERLLNIGISELPRHVEYVAWVDCDVILEDENWVYAATSRLDKNGGSLQLFGTSIHLSREIDVSSLSRQICRESVPILTGVSVASAVRSSVFDENKLKLSKSPSEFDDASYYRAIDQHNCHGFAWAALRATIEECGHYDRNIIGGGDAVHVFGGLSNLNDYFSLRPHTDEQKQDIISWVQKAKAVGLLSNIDSLEHRLYHMWHGNIANRNYIGRFDILERHGFDPAKDIEIASNGTWRWANPQSELARDVEAYFFSRREDGSE
jgi:hypothetical protein